MFRKGLHAIEGEAMKGWSRIALGMALFGGIFLGFSRAGLAADADSCTAINSVPATITQPGVYCLGKDIAAFVGGGSAITIDSSDVTLDLRGFRLGELSGPGT